MDDKTLTALKAVFDMSLSNYSWWFIAAAMALFFKSMIEKIVSGLIFYFSRDYNVDDEVYLFGSKKARIARQTLTKTTFYLVETNRKLVVPNQMLPNLQIETTLKSESDTPSAVILSKK